MEITSLLFFKPLLTILSLNVASFCRFFAMLLHQRMEVNCVRLLEKQQQQILGVNLPQGKSSNKSTSTTSIISVIPATLQTHSQSIVRWGRLGSEIALDSQIKRQLQVRSEGQTIKMYSHTPTTLVQIKSPFQSCTDDGQSFSNKSATDIQRIWRGSVARKRIKTALAGAKYQDDELDDVSSFMQSHPFIFKFETFSPFLRIPKLPLSTFIIAFTQRSGGLWPTRSRRHIRNDR